MARTLAAVGLVVAVGVGTLLHATSGLRSITRETTRRIAVRENPRGVPPARLQLQDGRETSLRALEGRVVVATFMYTSCRTLCPVVGARMNTIRMALGRAVDEGRVHFLSVSFDPAVDTPDKLAGFARNLHASVDTWWVARPRPDPAALLSAFGVTVIPAGPGMYVHNAAYYLIDRDQRLVGIFDENEPEAVLAAVKAML